MKTFCIVLLSLSIFLSPSISQPVIELGSKSLKSSRSDRKSGKIKLSGEIEKRTPKKEKVSAGNDPIVGTVWNFLGINRQKINEFTFLRNGKVKCENTYTNAVWKRLDESNILFGYGLDESYIVFRVSDEAGKNMKGFHYSGRARYLQRTE